MIFCAVGDIHGAMKQMYADVLDFERALQVAFEWVLHVGDFGQGGSLHREAHDRDGHRDRRPGTGARRGGSGR